MHGGGTFTFPDGSVYEGEFKDGYQHGEGALTLTDGTSVRGLWKDGENVSNEYSIDLHEPSGEEKTDKAEKTSKPEESISKDDE